MEPELSIVLFRRTGWSAAHYQAWSDAELAAGRSFVVPTTWAGEVVLRFCIVNPLTSVGDIAAILDSLTVEIAVDPSVIDHAPIDEGLHG